MLSWTLLGFSESCWNFNDWNKTSVQHFWNESKETERNAPTPQANIIIIASVQLTSHPQSFLNLAATGHNHLHSGYIIKYDGY